MSPQLRETLLAYLDRTPLKGPWLFPGGTTDRLPMTPKGFAWHWKRLMKSAGLPRRGPHALRHSWASLVIARGESPLYIRDHLGHASIKITYDAYGHLMQRSGPSGAARLDDDDWQSLPPIARLNRNPGATSPLKLVKNSN